MSITFSSGGFDGTMRSDSSGNIDIVMGLLTDVS